MLSFVVAIAENNVIGREKSLAWYLPNDLKKFKEITLTGSKTMIMGRKTFESLPNVLPGRKHIILTRNNNYNLNDENVEVIHSIEELTKYIDSREEYFVIGGGEIFNLLFPYTQKLYITYIHENFQGDTFFPVFNQSEWKILNQKEGITDERNKYKHTFVTLEKI